MVAFVSQLATLAAVPTNKPFVHLILDPEMLEQIDEVRWTLRLPSRTAAIRWLLAAALEERVIPEPDMSPEGTFIDRESQNLKREAALERRRSRKEK